MDSRMGCLCFSVPSTPPFALGLRPCDNLRIGSGQEELWIYILLFAGSEMMGDLVRGVCGSMFKSVASPVSL